MDNDNAPMGKPLSEAEDAAARIRAYLDACSGANSFGREIRWELRDAEGHPYNLPRADLVAVLDGLAAEAKDCEILEEGYINAMDDYGNQMTEVEQLRARVGVLEGQLATAREQLAPFTAQHRPCKNMFRTCVTCRDGYGEPLPWPCRDAKRLGLVTTCPACSDWVLRDGDANCPSCDADLTALALGLDGGGSDE